MITIVLDSEYAQARIIRAIERTPLDGKQEVVIKPKKRTRKQNGRLHMMLTAIIDAGTSFAGREWDINNWREIMLALYLKFKREETGTIIDLDGDFVVIGRRSSTDLSTKEFGEWMVMIQQWMDERQIPWAERDPPGYEGLA